MKRIQEKPCAFMTARTDSVPERVTSPPVSVWSLIPFGDVESNPRACRLRFSEAVRPLERATPSAI